MKGTVLIYDENAHSGKISGFDGKRYSFTRVDFVDASKSPTQGMEVDFEPQGDTAKEIVIIKSVKITQTGNNTDFNISHLDPYWQEELTKIHESNGTYKGKWNWPAFFFGSIWALIKGLWLNAIITFLILLGISALTAGLGTPILSIAGAIYYGIRGNNLMYQKQILKKNPIL